MVAADEYDSYTKGDTNKSEFGRVMAYVIGNYVVAGQYIRPGTESAATKHMDSFIVLRRRVLPGMASR